MKIMGDILGKFCHCIDNNENLAADDALERADSTNSWKLERARVCHHDRPLQKGD